jgi:hypothetical protein
MAKVNAGMGVSLIHIGSILIGLNLVGWVCFGASPSPVLWFVGIWLVGILTVSIEERRTPRCY